jgi:hypothetical protein
VGLHDGFCVRYASVTSPSSFSPLKILCPAKWKLVAGGFCDGSCVHLARLQAARVALSPGRRQSSLHTCSLSRKRIEADTVVSSAVRRDGSIVAANRC